MLGLAVALIVALLAVPLAAESQPAAIQSSFYSGYAVRTSETGQHYTSAAGTWRVPAHSFTPGFSVTEGTAMWVGIGCTDTSLIQLGTFLQVLPSGVSSYGAFVELFPDTLIFPAQQQYPVHPGDLMTASIECIDSCSTATMQSWSLSMTDHTANWTWTGSFTRASTLATACWILEAPPSASGPAILANYETTRFYDLTANGLNPHLSASSTRWVMVNQAGTSNPSAPAGGNAFNLCWGGGTTPMQCSPPGPKIAVSSPGLAFGTVAIGSASSLQMTAYNQGMADLSIGAVTLDGATAGSFKKPVVKDLCSGTTLAPSETCTVGLKFKPKNGGIHGAALVIPSNDPLANVVVVNLGGTGNGPEITVDPMAINFLSLPIGGQTAAKKLTIRNEGTQNLTVGGITVGGANSSQFGKPAAKDLCSGTSLAPTQTCTVKVKFKPTSAGEQRATLLIPSNDFNESAVTIALSGTGL